nr:acyl carrier protein [Herbidospora daliensis]
MNAGKPHVEYGRPSATPIKPSTCCARTRPSTVTTTRWRSRRGPEDLSIRRPLVEQGLDSVMTIMVRRRLEKRFGRRLPTTLLWQQPTMAVPEKEQAPSSSAELISPSGPG